MPETLPWWKSRVIVGVLISAIFKLLFIVGITDEVDDATVESIIEAVLLGASFIGDFIAGNARVVQTAAPKITATKGN